MSDPDPGDRTLTGTVVSAAAGSSCPGGSPAASCTASVTVLVPALQLRVTSTATTVVPGASVPYTWTLANTGQTPSPATSATLALGRATDDAGYDRNAVASAGTLTYADADGGTLTWSGDLAVGATVTVTLSLTVRNPDPGDRSVTAVAASSAAGSTCPPGSSSAACTSTVSVLVPALSLRTSADVTSTTPGSVVRYTTVVANPGQTPYQGAVASTDLSGVLDDATYRSDVAASTGTATLSGSTVSWTGDLAVGATATITFSVTVRSPDPGDHTLTSTVSSSSPFASCPAGGSGAGCTSTVPVLLPGLSLVVATDVASTTPGSTVRYTVTARNTGQTAYAGAIVTWDLAGVLDDAA